MPLRIAIDASLIGTQSTGDATYWRGLIAGLLEIDSGCEFLLFSNAAKPDFVPESPNFRWIEVHASNKRWWSLVAFPLAARKLGAQVLHTQYSLSPLAGKRSITTIHDVSFFIEPSWFQPRDRALLQTSCRLAAKLARRILTVSQTSASEVESYLPRARGKVTVTYPACGSGIAAMPKESAAALLRASLGIEPPFFLTVGTRWPRKNMQLAIDAVSALGPGAPRLVITGKPGWGEEQLSSHAIPTGFVSDEVLSALYSAADLYLAPSRHEGFGITLLEAFRCGCPVICSPGGAHPEVAGAAAHVMADFDPSEWAEAIRRLLTDSSKLDSMRRLGREREAEFSWKRMAEQTLQVYREVAL